MITGLLILFPFLAMLALWLTKDARVARRNALIGAWLQLPVAIAAICLFQCNGFREIIYAVEWIPSMGVSFNLALDGLSLLLVLLTAVLIPVIVSFVPVHNTSSPRKFYALIFMAQMAMTGVFLVRDGLMFYIFWELALIPLYFITALWGGENRIRITFKFFIYTMAGSLLMLVALIYLYLQTPYPHSFDFGALYSVALSTQQQIWVFLAFFVAFAIKIPVFPLHTWQPDTYTTAPYAGSMILSGIMLKMGIYGIIRFITPLFIGTININLEQTVLILALVGLLYASVIAIRQDDLKRFVAYVSLAHVALITMGAIIGNNFALQGAGIQMFSHGINVVGLFIIVQIIEEKTNTRKISQLGGLAKKMPLLAVLFMIILLGSIGLPLTNGFVGEYLLLYGIYQYNVWMAAFAGLTIIFGAVYMFKMFQHVMLGDKKYAAELTDIGTREATVLIPLCLLVILIGVYPKPLIDMIQPTIDNILNVITIAH